MEIIRYMAEPRSESPKPTPKEIPALGVRPFELELADRISKSEVLPTLKKMERVDYDFSKVETGPNLDQVTDLFGTKEMADFAAQEGLSAKKMMRFDGQTEFGGKSYQATRVLVSEPHSLMGVEPAGEGLPTKVVSVLLLKEIGGEPVEGKLTDKLQKLVDKSAVGRKLKDVVEVAIGERPRSTGRLREGQFPQIDLDQFDSVIFGLWANPAQSPDGSVVYEDAQIEVLHPDYSSSRRAMQYNLFTSFARKQNSISSEPLRTDKSAEELHQEEVARAQRAMEGKKSPSEERVARIPSRTAWFDFDGKNITDTLKAT